MADGPRAHLSVGDARRGLTAGRRGRELLRWGLNLARRDPSVRPWLAALHARDLIPFEWLAFWVSEDPAGEGLARIREALDRGVVGLRTRFVRGDDLSRNAYGIGVVHGSLAPGGRVDNLDTFGALGPRPPCHEAVYLPRTEPLDTSSVMTDLAENDGEKCQGSPRGLDRDRLTSRMSRGERT